MSLSKPLSPLLLALPTAGANNTQQWIKDFKLQLNGSHANVAAEIFSGTEKTLPIVASKPEEEDFANRPRAKEKYQKNVVFYNSTLGEYKKAVSAYASATTFIVERLTPAFRESLVASSEEARDAIEFQDPQVLYREILDFAENSTSGGSILTKIDHYIRELVNILNLNDSSDLSLTTEMIETKVEECLEIFAAFFKNSDDPNDDEWMTNRGKLKAYFRTVSLSKTKHGRYRERTLTKAIDASTLHEFPSSARDVVHQATLALNMNHTTGSHDKGPQRPSVPPANDRTVSSVTQSKKRKGGTAPTGDLPKPHCSTCGRQHFGVCDSRNAEKDRGNSGRRNGGGNNGGGQRGGSGGGGGSAGSGNGRHQARKRGGGGNAKYKRGGGNGGGGIQQQRGTHLHQSNSVREEIGTIDNDDLGFPYQVNSTRLVEVDDNEEWFDSLHSNITKPIDCSTPSTLQQPSSASIPVHTSVNAGTAHPTSTKPEQTRQTTETKTKTKKGKRNPDRLNSVPPPVKEATADCIAVNAHPAATSTKPQQCPLEPHSPISLTSSDPPHGPAGHACSGHASLSDELHATRLATVRVDSVKSDVKPASVTTWDPGSQITIVVETKGLTDIRNENTHVIGVGGRHVYTRTGYSPIFQTRVVICDSNSTVNALVGTKTLEVAYKIDKVVLSNDGKLDRVTFVHKASRLPALHFIRETSGPNADLMVLHPNFKSK